MIVLFRIVKDVSTIQKKINQNMITNALTASRAISWIKTIINVIFVISIIACHAIVMENVKLVEKDIMFY